MSADKAMRLYLKRMSTSDMSESKGGPAYRHSLGDGPVDLADASYTIRPLVVCLSSRITGWCGK